MISLENKKDCCGCTACYSICPTSAISMQKDEKGFFYPEVNIEKCVNCNACDKVCPMKDMINKDKIESPKLYAFRHNDDEVLMNSSSGGAFTAFSEKILEQGGYVVGAIIDDSFQVSHAITDSIQGRNEMRRSKYVSSNLGNTFKELLPLAKKGMPILFTGTPCQVDGFRKYIKHNDVEMNNIYLCSLVCHGVSSPEFWDKYISYVQRRKNAHIEKINFRNKDMGWRKSKYIAECGNEKLNLVEYETIFGMCLSNRECCFSCPYTTPMRQCDITMGDFWSIRNYVPEFQENEGVSLILTHSSKGEKLLRETLEYAKIVSISYNPEKDFLLQTLNSPYQKPVEYDIFWKDFFEKPIEEILKKYTGTKTNERIARKFRRAWLSMKK